jgi:hypothetical protein
MGTEHYVYLYFDHDRIRYIGYGRKISRADSHLTGSHNDALNQFLEEGKYRIEIAGPFDDEGTGRAVETALISAIKPEFNINNGPSKWRFRPLGVPIDFAPRLDENELTMTDFLRVQGAARTPVLFVIIALRNYDPADPQSDLQIRERITCCWQLQRFLPGWSANPKASPGLLVAVFGSPGRQTVIASAHIAQNNWAAAKVVKGGLVRVPLVDTVAFDTLDAFDLRGRRIARSAGLMFGGIPAQFYAVLGADGEVFGGRQLRNTIERREVRPSEVSIPRE